MDARREKLRSDKLEPRCAKSKKDNAEPNLEKLRIEKLEPKCVHWITDRPLPASREHSPWIDREEPSRVKHLTERVDPKWAK